MRAWLTALFMTFASLAAPLAAEEVEAVEVDVELFLAVDVSRSMSPYELDLQRRGYAEALDSPEVLAAIQGSLTGQIALTYVEWAGEGAQRVVIPWTLVATQAQARAIADKLTFRLEQGMRRTSISGVLAHATASFDDNGFRGMRRVIDVSGDGPNNAGRPVLEARQEALSRGITINGLPLMTRDPEGRVWDIPDLDAYYLACVVGGPGAFVIPVHDWDQFATAIKRKLVLEIAGRPPERIWRAQMQAAAPYDCLVGERMWERNQRYWALP